MKLFLDSWDVVGMCTTASGWNNPKEYRPHGELFFLVEREPVILVVMVDIGTHSIPLEAEVSWCHVRFAIGGSDVFWSADAWYEDHNVENLSLSLSKSWGKAGQVGWSASFWRIGSLRG